MDEEQAELEYRLREARKLEDDLRKEKDKVTSKRQDIIDASRRDAVDLKRNLRVEAEKIIRELKAQSRRTDRERPRPSTRPAGLSSRFPCLKRKSPSATLSTCRN